MYIDVRLFVIYHNLLIFVELYSIVSVSVFNEQIYNLSGIKYSAKFCSHFRYLQKHGCSLFVQNLDGELPLHKACLYFIKHPSKSGKLDLLCHKYMYSGTVGFYIPFHSLGDIRTSSLGFDWNTQPQSESLNG